MSRNAVKVEESVVREAVVVGGRSSGLGRATETGTTRRICVCSANAKLGSKSIGNSVVIRMIARCCRCDRAGCRVGSYGLLDEAEPWELSRLREWAL